MSGDKEPVLFRRVFGALRPATPAAEELLSTLPDKPVRVEVHGIRGNTARMGLYWVCLKVACEQLADATNEAVFTPRLLHRWLKRDLGLSKPIVSKKTGEIIEWDDESIAFHNMPENERAQFIDAALDRISRRLGCDVTQLRSEAEAQFGQAA